MLPDFALTLYETLEEAIDGDGYNDYLIDDKYFDLDRKDVPSNVKPGDFIRRSETRPDGSVFRHASILVTTTESAGRILIIFQTASVRCTPHLKEIIRRRSG